MGGYKALVTANRVGGSTHHYRWYAPTRDADSPEEYAQWIKVMLEDHKATGTPPLGWNPEHDWAGCQLTKLEVYRDGQPSGEEPLLKLDLDL